MTPESHTFRYRVEYAASHISSGRETTRDFDNCFEMHDGNVVATALFRRAESNSTGNLAKNIYKYICEDLTRTNAAELALVPTRQLKFESERIISKACLDFDKMLEQK